MTSVLWLRRDLRLRDHPALVAAHESAGGGGVLPVFVADPRLLGPSGRVAALVEALASLDETYDGALVIRYGRPVEVLPALVREVGATSVHVSAETTPYGRRRDDQVRAALPVGVPLVDREPLRGHAGTGAQGERQPVSRLHTVRARVA